MIKEIFKYIASLIAPKRESEAVKFGKSIARDYYELLCTELNRANLRYSLLYSERDYENYQAHPTYRLYTRKIECLKERIQAKRKLYGFYTLEDLLQSYQGIYA